jgi:hypothetical protein
MGMFRRARALVDAIVSSGGVRAEAWVCVLCCLCPLVSRRAALRECDSARGMDSGPDRYVRPAAEQLLEAVRPWKRRSW